MKYRSRTEIATSILRVAASTKATKSRLMYGSYVSYTQIEEYLEYLTAQKLIIQDPGTNLYMLTEKGIRYLNLSDEMSELVAPLPEAPAVP